MEASLYTGVFPRVSYSCLTRLLHAAILKAELLSRKPFTCSSLHFNAFFFCS